MAYKALRSSTANKRPLASAIADGQLAVNTEATSPGLFFKNANGGLVKVGPCHIGTTAPNSAPATGGEVGNTLAEQWLDTSGTNPVLKVWDGGTWRTVQPVASASVITTADTGTVTSQMLANSTIVNEDISATAEIAVSKLADGAARQLLQTAANGTDVEWTSNVDIPGTLDVTGIATFDTSVKFPDGTAAAPGLHFTSDVNTGWFRVSADVLGIATNGTSKVQVDDTTAPLKELWSGAFYPVVTSVDIGTAANQIPLNSSLGALAFVDEVPRLRPNGTAPQNNQDINFEYVSDTSIKIRMRGTDGVVRSTTLTLS